MFLTVWMYCTSLPSLCCSVATASSFFSSSRVSLSRSGIWKEGWGGVEVQPQCVRACVCTCVCVRMHVCACVHVLHHQNGSWQAMRYVVWCASPSTLRRKVWLHLYTVFVHETDFRDSPISPMKLQNARKLHS